MDDLLLLGPILSSTSNVKCWSQTSKGVFIEKVCWTRMTRRFLLVSELLWIRIDCLNRNYAFLTRGAWLVIWVLANLFSKEQCHHIYKLIEGFLLIAWLREFKKIFSLKRTQHFYNDAFSVKFLNIQLTGKLFRLGFKSVDNKSFSHYKLCLLGMRHVFCCESCTIYSAQVVHSKGILGVFTFYFPILTSVQ